MEQGQRCKSPGRGPELGADRGFCQGATTSAPGLVKTGAQNRALLDVGRGGARGEGVQRALLMNEPCPQGAPELCHAHRKQGRRDPDRDGRKVLLNGGQLQVRCSRGPWGPQDQVLLTRE